MHDAKQGVLFTALVLAGSRNGPDVLASAAGVSGKGLVPVDGSAMLYRVLGALRETSRVDEIVVCGMEQSAFRERAETASLLGDPRITFLPGRATPAASVVHALESLPQRLPMLVTTADHPLLTAEMIDEFCTRAASSGLDVLAGLVDARLLAATYPQVRRTRIRFRDGAYCGCNLFALLTPEAHLAPRTWMRVEQHRKRPWKMFKTLGVAALARFLTRRLTLADAAELASREMGVRAGPVLLRWPEAAIDVDRLRDLELVGEILRAKSAQRRGQENDAS
jgi:GTP:adenosylcobinamide-phosphate guanylyltransferase